MLLYVLVLVVSVAVVVFIIMYLYFCYSELQEENMRRFVMKGSKFEPLRAQSAAVPGSHRRVNFRQRPKTAFGNFVTDSRRKHVQGPETSDKENTTGGLVVMGLMC